MILRFLELNHIAHLICVELIPWRQELSLFLNEFSLENLGTSAGVLVQVLGTFFLFWMDKDAKEIRPIRELDREKLIEYLSRFERCVLNFLRSSSFKNSETNNARSSL